MPVEQCFDRPGAAASGTIISGERAQYTGNAKQPAMCAQQGKQLEQRGGSNQQDQADDI